MPAAHTFTHIKITQNELLTEAKLRFGDNVMKIAFTCPTCEDTATLADFRDLNVDPGRAGQDCIGRHLGACDAKTKRTPYTGRGCDWAAYGLFHGPWEIVLPVEEGKPERSMWAFPLAGEPAEGGPVAAHLAAKAEAAR